MGLFSKKPPQASEKYLFYQTKAARFRKMFVEIKSSIKTKKQVELVYFFEKTSEELKQLLSAAQIEFDDNEIMIGFNSLVTLWSYEKLTSQVFDTGHTYICADVHPLRSKNEALLKSIGEGNKVLFFISFDSPIFMSLEMEKIKKMMEKMGVGENEQIEFKMFTQSLIRDQKKWEEKIENERHASSLEDWIASNT